MCAKLPYVTFTTPILATWLNKLGGPRRSPAAAQSFTTFMSALMLTPGVGVVFDAPLPFPPFDPLPPPPEALLA